MCQFCKLFFLLNSMSWVFLIGSATNRAYVVALCSVVIAVSQEPCQEFYLH